MGDVPDPSVSFEVKVLSPSPTRVVVRVAGVLDEHTGAELSEKVGAQLERGVTHVLLDLRGLTDCKILGRQALRQLQGTLLEAGARTAYLTGSPRMRGMTLMVINGSKDPYAATFVNPPEADDWLESEVDRRARNVAFTEKNA